MKIENSSSLLAKYSLLYEKNPKSRVFAPLAEVYRKLGMLDKAYRILKKGIKLHPHYVLGHIVLAQCFYDEKKFDLAYNSLMPYVESNLDNISLQKLFGNVCLQLEYYEEALKTFKYLLFLNPRDKYAQIKVKEIEDNFIPNKNVQIENETTDIDQFLNNDDWVQVDFTEPEHNRRKTDRPFKQEASEVVQPVVDKKSPQEMVQELRDKFEMVTPFERNLDDEYYLQEFDSEDEAVAPEDEKPDTPIVTLTLVDLYCQQGYHKKALEYLDTFLRTNPDDQRLIDKRKEVVLLIEGGDQADVVEMSTAQKNLAKVQEELDADQDKLLDLVDEKVHQKDPLQVIKNLMMAYVEQVKKQAEQYENKHH
jgi:tetratricopeptide (TPR) repeat protein